jgi:hypothetical protein
MKIKIGEFYLAVPLALILCAAAGCATSRQLNISSQPPGATIYVDGKDVGVAPVQQLVQWPNKKTYVVVSAKKQDYQSVTYKYGRAEAEAAQNPWPINFSLTQVSVAGTLNISCNIPDANVVVSANGKQWKYKVSDPIKLPFTRKNGNSPWSAFAIRVFKDKYEYKPAKGPAIREFSMTVSPANFPADGRLFVDLEPIEYYLGVILRYELGGDGFRIGEEKFLSQVGEIEQEPRASAVTMVSDLPSNLPLIETKLSVSPSGDVLYTLPVWVGGSIKGANLWMQHGVEKSQLTDGNYFDLTPGVSADGKWIYFSSNRSGKFNIWRIQANGKGGIGQITDSPSSQDDYEPVLSPDGKHLAYASLRTGSKVWQIWFCDPDGALPTQICEGGQPAWSPDSSKLAYVAANPTTGKDNIWIVDADGSNPRCIAQSAASNFRHPDWTPDGRIVYDSDTGVNNTTQKHNFDIWIVNADGSNPTQLTVNGSYDADPAVTPGGKSVFFLSNRGVQEDMQDNLQIWRLDLASSQNQASLR